MGSEQNDGTSYQPSEPKPCANNCGFWGRSDTMDLCSKCYRDFQMKEQQAALAKAAMEKSLGSPKVASSPHVETETETETTKVVLSSSLGSTSSSLVTEKPAVEMPMPKAVNRCQSCNKKVGLTGFKCKCGFTFCGNHRYPESHECSFDFKSVGRNEIAKANPLVKADKVDRI